MAFAHDVAQPSVYSLEKFHSVFRKINSVKIRIIFRLLLEFLKEISSLCIITYRRRDIVRYFFEISSVFLLFILYICIIESRLYDP